MSRFLVVFVSIFVSVFALADGQSKFTYGPVINDFGRHAAVSLQQPFDENLQLKVAFDVSEAAESGQVNRRFESLARFINMHAANGVKPENIQLALVVHGKAGFDLLNKKAYKQKYDTENPNIALLEQLAAHQVSVHICGQSAAYYEIDAKDLHDSVVVELSAMTAHAMLARQGYSLNPF